MLLLLASMGSWVLRTNQHRFYCLLKLPTHRTQAIPVGVHLVCVYLKELSLVRRLLCRASRVRCETYFWESLLLSDRKTKYYSACRSWFKSTDRWGNPHFISLLYMNCKVLSSFIYLARNYLLQVVSSLIGSTILGYIRTSLYLLPKFVSKDTFYCSVQWTYFSHSLLSQEKGV